MLDNNKVFAPSLLAIALSTIIVSPTFAADANNYNELKDLFEDTGGKKLTAKDTINLKTDIDATTDTPKRFNKLQDAASNDLDITIDGQHHFLKGIAFEKLTGISNTLIYNYDKGGDYVLDGIESGSINKVNFYKNEVDNVVIGGTIEDSVFAKNIVTNGVVKIYKGDSIKNTAFMHNEGTGIVVDLAQAGINKFNLENTVFYGNNSYSISITNSGGTSILAPPNLKGTNYIFNGITTDAKSELKLTNEGTTYLSGKSSLGANVTYTGAGDLVLTTVDGTEATITGVGTGTKFTFADGTLQGSGTITASEIEFTKGTIDLSIISIGLDKVDGVKKSDFNNEAKLRTGASFPNQITHTTIAKNIQAKIGDEEDFAKKETNRYGTLTLEGKVTFKDVTYKASVSKTDTDLIAITGDLVLKDGFSIEIEGHYTGGTSNSYEIDGKNNGIKATIIKATKIDETALTTKLEDITLTSKYTTSGPIVGKAYYEVDPSGSITSVIYHDEAKLKWETDATIAQGGNTFNIASGDFTLTGKALDNRTHIGQAKSDLTKTGDGTLIFDTDGTYAGETIVKQGGIKLKAGNSLESELIAVSTGANFENSGTVKGEVDLSGGFTNIGTVEGKVTIDDGGLFDNKDSAIIDNSVDISDKGTFEGYGTIKGDVLLDGGTLQVGYGLKGRKSDPSKTLTINGKLEADDNSAINITIHKIAGEKATAWDKLKINEFVDSAGAGKKVKLGVIGENLKDFNNSITLITVDNLSAKCKSDINSCFVAEDKTFTKLKIKLVGNEIQATADFHSAYLLDNSISKTKNQINVAKGLHSSFSSTASNGHLYKIQTYIQENQDPAKRHKVTSLLDQISGEVYAANNNALLEASLHNQSAINTRIFSMSDLLFANQKAQVYNLGGYINNYGTSTSTGENAFWISPVLRKTTMKADTEYGSAKSTLDATGLLIGMDNLRTYEGDRYLGFVVGRDTSKVDLKKERASDSEITSTYVGAYTGEGLLYGGLLFSRSEIKTKRSTPVDERQLNAKQTANQLHGFVELSTKYRFSNAIDASDYYPYINLSVTQLKVNEASEDGGSIGGASLKLHSYSRNLASTILGFRTKNPVESMQSTMIYTDFGYKHAWSKTKNNEHQFLYGVGGTFEIKGGDSSKDAGFFALGLHTDLDHKNSIFVEARGEVSNKLSSASANIGYQSNF